MQRGNRLVIPLKGVREEMHSIMAMQFGGREYHSDCTERIELSLEECMAVVANLPTIVNFIIKELPEDKKTRL